MLEYPVWLITGMLIPLSLLPGWIHPLSWVLAPTWGMRAVRRSALGGSVGTPLLVCLLLTIAYTVLAVLLLHHFERLARDRATLSLS
jgi:ABC-2 type transport system permease protein